MVLRQHTCFGKCTCQFIPPIVTSNLSKSGVEAARTSSLESQRQRNRRKQKDISVSLLAATQTGDSLRQVYDCQSKWVQRVQLVRSEGAAAVTDPVANQVYDSVGIVRDFFKTVLGRNSIDNLGLNLVLNVHFGKKYMNAFWDGDEMTFGDGDGKIFTNFAQSLDVIAHELAHGVTQFTANLEYKNQSGALNESFSDVFGTAITQFAKGETAETADWLIGDEIMGPELYGEALRSMKEPGTAYDNSLMGKDPQPAHMKDYYAGAEDNGGVHINSGIPNKAFYLTAMDIGTDKAIQIWYAGLLRMSATADFNTAASALVEAARVLVRDGKIPVGSPQVVRGAFRAVGIPTV